MIKTIGKAIWRIDQCLTKWVRWKIVVRLDKRREYCWTSLVLWAAHPELHPALDLIDECRDAGQCARLGEHPYCGKCQDTGVHLETNPNVPFICEETGQIVRVE
jgi:hypothetical protein